MGPLSRALGLEVKQEIEAKVEGLTVKDLIPEGNRFTILIAAQAAGMRLLTSVRWVCGRTSR